MEDAWDKYREHLDIRFKHEETLCGPRLIGAQAAKEYYTSHVDAFIGPVCNDGLIQLGYMAVNWNIPVLSPRGNTRLVRNTTIFPNIISLHPFGKFELVRFVIYLLDMYNWEHLTVFTDKDSLVLDTTGKSFFEYLQKETRLIWSYIPVYSSTFTDEDWDAKLNEASLTSRVFILILSLKDVRTIMLRAARLGKTNGEYVYIVPEFQTKAAISKEVWQKGERNDVRARKAFRSVLFINVLNPPLKVYDTLIGRLNYKVFGDAFLNILMADSDEVGDEEIVSATDREIQQAILAGYYNAIQIYLSAANETLSQGGSLQDGVSLARRIYNTTFDGITGPIHINSDGHRDTDMELVDMVDPWKGEFARVGVFHADRGEMIMEEGAKISWPGRAGPVADIPECGFQDSLCMIYESDEESDTLTVGLAVGGGVALIVIVIIVVLVLYCKGKNEVVDLTWWRIGLDEVEPVKTKMTRSTASSSLGHSKKTVGGSDVSSIVDNDVCNYKAVIVRLHRFNKSHVHMRQRLVKEFLVLRDINHPNLLKFHGACLDGDAPFLAYEHCPKGSLQELFQGENNFELDTPFQTSLITDIVNALIYLHKRSMKFHGRLTSDVCYIDSRFTVKIGGYGIPTIHENDEKTTEEKQKNCLWTAPEHLRIKETKGSQEGDIYSLAIIMSEVLSRDEPYSQDREYVTIGEIINKIKYCENPPFRPAICFKQEMSTVHSLMMQCWEENPNKRPSLVSISHIMNGLMAKYNKGGGLIDNLLERLEKYSTNLEKILEDKVTELQVHKQKSDELLNQLLPKAVADKLKAGLTVLPEVFDCVTIYFSDIVGFTTMCSGLQPVQIVNLMNDLYSTFDQIISEYDVFKVETIGDAYMVVSGLPTRNGNEHARQIARMSLALCKVVQTYSPVEVPDDRIMLRIGLHSGSVCAGVVGQTMPRYCLFGENVNVASAMEASGVEWKIHMSNTTAELLKGYSSFLMTKRGDTEIKGKGTMETYWLLGEAK